MELSEEEVVKRDGSSPKTGTGQKRNPVKGIMEVSEKEGHRSKRGTAICSWGIIAVMCVGPADPLEQ